MRKPAALFIALMTLLLAPAVPLQAEESADTLPPEAVPGPAAPAFSFALGASPSLSLSLGRLAAATLGATVRFAWRPAAEVTLDAAFSARWLVGHDFSLAVTGLWAPLASGRWSLAFGPSLALSYESRMVGYTQDDPAPTGGVYGPYWAAAAGIVVAPLQFRFEAFDLSFCRLFGGVLLGAWLAAPLFTVDLVGIAFHL